MKIHFITFIGFTIFSIIGGFMGNFIYYKRQRLDILDKDIMELRTYSTESLRDILKVPDLISMGMGNRIVAILLERYDERLHILENSQKCEHLQCKQIPCMYGCKKFCNAEKIKE